MKPQATYRHSRRHYRRHLRNLGKLILDVIAAAFILYICWTVVYLADEFLKEWI